jgi:hypothetical protein
MSTTKTVVAPLTGGGSMVQRRKQLTDLENLIRQDESEVGRLERDIRRLEREIEEMKRREQRALVLEEEIAKLEQGCPLEEVLGVKPQGPAVPRVVASSSHSLLTRQHSTGADTAAKRRKEEEWRMAEEERNRQKEEQRKRAVDEFKNLRKVDSAEDLSSRSAPRPSNTFVFASPVAMRRAQSGALDSTSPAQKETETAPLNNRGKAQDEEAPPEVQHSARPADENVEQKFYSYARLSTDPPAHLEGRKLEVSIYLSIST